VNVTFKSAKGLQTKAFIDIGPLAFAAGKIRFPIVALAAGLLPNQG
jgi:hypothetical protein